MCCFELACESAYAQRIRDVYVNVETRKKYYSLTKAKAAGYEQPKQAMDMEGK